MKLGFTSLTLVDCAGFITNSKEKRAKKVGRSSGKCAIQSAVSCNSKAFRGWSKRIEMLVKGGGHHIEHKLSGGKNSDNK